MQDELDILIKFLSWYTTLLVEKKENNDNYCLDMAGIPCTIPAIITYVYMLMIHDHMSRSTINSGEYTSAWFPIPLLYNNMLDSLHVEPQITFIPI